MEGKKLLESIRLQNLLSYGPQSEAIKLEPLNVLIGPNASGKSNLIEAISLLRATPRDLAVPFREGGGIREWLWKGTSDDSFLKIESMVKWRTFNRFLTHRLDLLELNQKPYILDETIEDSHPREGFVYQFEDGKPLLTIESFSEGAKRYRNKRTNIEESVKPDQSILAQLKDPHQYPEITYLGRIYDTFKIYRDWNVGRRSAVRLPAQADLPDDFLLDDGSNLALVLNDLQNKRAAHRQLIEKLRVFYREVEDITTKVQGGTVQIFVHEKGIENPIPATRLSDGTLRYLCLLAILCHPTPPPLICIEEPELGLHPDIMPTVAELLIEASQRTQLIVTTHSTALVSALSDMPEAVLVCERNAEGTQLRRLAAEPLQDWLETYSLGTLWSMGEIGGNP